MSIVRHCVALGFARAARRAHLLLLDLFAKLLWGAGAVMVAGLAGTVFLSRIVVSGGDLDALESGLPPLQFVALAGILAANLGVLWLTASLAGVVIVAGWILVEAFVHAGTLVPGERAFIRAAAAHFGRFLATGLLRRIVLASVAILLFLAAAGPLLMTTPAEWGDTIRELAWPIVAGTGLILMLSVFLGVLETVLRVDAGELLGSDLPALAGLAGLLLVIEAGVHGTAAMAAWLLAAAGPPGLQIILAAGVVLVWSTAHGYLLMVRYSAVDIMRQHTPPTGGRQGLDFIKY